jgi:hypothetical protein
MWAIASEEKAYLWTKRIKEFPRHGGIACLLSIFGKIVHH